MAEYIEREALLLKLNNALSLYKCPNPKCSPISFGSMLGMQDAVKMVAEFPAADVAEVRRGEWVYGEYNDPHCSECGNYYPAVTPYCPHCGAFMDEEDET